MNNDTEYAYMRSILGEGKFELMSAFEHGLFNPVQFHESFKKTADNFSEIGLEYGAEKFKELSEIVSSARFDLNWNIDGAVLLISQLWNYIKVCLARLNFYEILSEMNESK